MKRPGKGLSWQWNEEKVAQESAIDEYPLRHPLYWGLPAQIAYRTEDGTISDCLRKMGVLEKLSLGKAFLEKLLGNA